MLAFVVPFLNKRFSPSSYAVSRKEYYERALFPQNTHAFLGYETGFSATSLIQYKDMNWGMPESKIMELCGAPRYSVTVTIAGYMYKVIFYRELTEGKNYLVQLHFINDSFFYSCNTLRAEKNFTQRDIIKTGIITTYSGTKINTAKNPIVLSDADNNRIIITDSVYFHLGYLSGGKDLSGILAGFNSLLDSNAALTDNKEIKVLYA